MKFTIKVMGPGQFRSVVATLEEIPGVKVEEERPKTLYVIAELPDENAAANVVNLPGVSWVEEYGRRLLPKE